MQLPGIGLLIYNYGDNNQKNEANSEIHVLFIFCAVASN